LGLRIAAFGLDEASYTRRFAAPVGLGKAAAVTARGKAALNPMHALELLNDVIPRHSGGLKEIAVPPSPCSRSSSRWRS